MTFQTAATGTAPLSYQWFRNGTPIPGAVASQFNLAAVATADHTAAFSVRVTNALGSVTSPDAILTVDFGVAGAAVTNRLLNFTNVWRYNQSNNLDAINWTAPGYDDTAWPAGPGLLAAENNSAITPLIGTTLLAPSAPPAGLATGHAYYFRTTINAVSNNLIPGALLATIRADDGAAIYLNGAEALRLRIPTGPISNLTFTTDFPPGGSSDATTDEVIPLIPDQLTPGPNVIAASVHQANATSSDVVWGLALDEVRYQRVRDTVAPTIATLLPAPGGVIPGLSTLEVHFSEGVQGVHASDLLVNGVAATNVVEFAADVYVFRFPPPPTGAVQVAWIANPGITDRSANSNTFAGGSYNYTVNPAAIAADVRITEFMAGNTATVRDNDGEFSDWIEIYNAAGQALDLGGWYLTDSAANLSKWRFPTGLSLPANSYLLVWASDKNRTNVAAPLHTNFKLSKGAGNFLGLVYLDGATVVSTFANYPAQFDNVSYGRDRLDGSIVGYFTNATPGAVNATVGLNFATPVKFSRASGTFQSTFSLTLSTEASNSVIRYFLVTNAVSAALTNVPNSSSTIYTGPFPVSSSVQVRARAFATQTNIFPSEPTSATYLQITAGAANFNSEVPIVLFYNFNGGTPSATADQSAVMMVFGTDYGRASLTNPPTVAARIGLNIRGSSTQGLAKKSFAVETWDEFNDDAKQAVLDLPPDSDWVFYAPNLYDKPWIHNPFMHELSHTIGRYSPRARMVEVFNCFDATTVTYSTPAVGNYNGIYVLEEKIKAGNNRVDVPRLDPVETNAPAITGGYILKVDRADADERSLYAGNVGMVYVEPQMKDYATYAGRATQENYIAGYFNSFYSVLSGANWTNASTGYAAWIDVDSWVDHHILNVLALSSDALRLSAYFFKDRNKKIEMGPLWDFDRGLGSSAASEWRSWNPRSWMGSNPSGAANGTDFGTDFFNASGVFSNPWYGRLVQDPDFWQKWIDRYQALRATAFATNSLFAIIDGLTNNLGVAQSREIAKWSDSVPRFLTVGPPAGWPDTSYSNIFNGTYAGEIVFLKRWLTDRVNFIDTNFLAQPSLSRTGGLVSVGQVLTLTPAAKAGSKLFYTLNGTDPRLPGGAISPAALSNSGPVTIQITNNIRVVARSWNPTHQNLTGPNNPPISSPWSGPQVASFYTSLPALRVTELMFNPPPAPVGNTNDADNFEFIELKNTGATPLNVAGFRLGGGIDFVFPSLTLTGGQYVVVVKNLAAFQSRYGSSPLVAGVYTNNLGNGGDHLVLQGPLLEPILDFTYSDHWYPATDGAGFSLVIVNPLALPDSWSLPASWRPSGALNGSPGVADPTPNLPAVLINEVLTHTDPPLLDTVELFNPTLGVVNLGGWFLTDDPHVPKKYRIPAGSFLAPGDFMTFTADQFGVGANAFSFSSTGDAVYLFSGDANTNLTGYAHGFDFGAAPNPVAFGRYVNSQGREQFVLQSANSLGARNKYPRVGPVVISEIMYHPPDLAFSADDDLNEFIELQNITATNVPLYDLSAPTNTWHLRNAVDFDFPTNTILPAGGRLLVVGFDPAIYGALKSAFVFKYNVPTNVPIFGPWSGKLDNSSETIELERPDNPNVTPTNIFIPNYLVEKVAYSQAAPWPANADGTGASLQRLEPTLFANDPLNWRAATPTAGVTNPAGDVVDIDQDGLPDVWELANAIDPQVATGASGALGDADGDGANNLHEYLAGTNPNDSNDYLRFTQVTVSNQLCRLSFPTRVGRTYAVENVSTLSSTNSWVALTNGITGTGGVILITDPSGPAPRYYRLKVTFLP